jgi:magnesium-transporting ATPase (P-type)
MMALLTQDPPREEIPEVVRICRTAGIRFFMVTGYVIYMSNI